jgi:hypothetical protein
MVGCFEKGNGSPGFINCWEILEQISGWWLLKKGSALCS